MRKQTVAFVLLTGILLTACAGLTAKSTETPTLTPEPPTATQPVVTEAPLVTEAAQTLEPPTPTTTPTVFVPANPADCTNSAVFVADVTIPDNSNVIAGVTFTKTWRVKNNGTCTWWSGYTLTHYSDERMGAPLSVPLDVTYPGDTTDISITLISPTSVGAHRGNFVIKNPAGLIMSVDNDSRLWVVINVVSEEPVGVQTATSTAPAVSGTPTTAAGAGFASVSCAFTTDQARNSQLVAAINAYRAQSNLPPYAVNDRLSQAAQAHANDMACNQLFGHDGSNGSTPQSRLAASGYTAAESSENVYGSYPPLTPEQAVLWWKTDLTDLNHNKNLLSTNYKEIGVGYTFFNNFGYYVVVFAKP